MVNEGEQPQTSAAEQGPGQLQHAKTGPVRRSPPGRDRHAAKPSRPRPGGSHAKQPCRSGPAEAGQAAINNC